LCQLDVPLAVLCDIDPKEISNCPFDGGLEPSGLHVLHNLQYFCTLLADVDRVISLENIDALLPDKDAGAGGQLDEANAFELFDQMQEPNMTSLLLAIDVPKDLQNTISLSVHLASLGDFHVHVALDWCLDVCHDVVNLQGVPVIDDGQDKDKADDPVSYRCICFIIILPKDLTRSIEAELHLPLVYLLGEDTALLLHLPNSWDDSCPSWNLTLLVDGKVPSINLSI